MATENDDEDNTHKDIEDILTAAINHDLERLEKCFKVYRFDDCEPMDVKDPKTGRTPLHTAIAACEKTSDLLGTDKTSHGAALVADTTMRPLDEESGEKTVRFLLENGAIWNQLDADDETPGCLARRLGLLQLYQLMVDAGVRAETLLNRLDGYEPLGDDENESNFEEADSADQTLNHLEPVTDVRSTQYLSSVLSMDDNKILDDKQNAVMMNWERGIMQQSADELLRTPDLRVLNIGFGMGIIDGYIQRHANRPSEHHIIEAHPDVLERMTHEGWHNKPGVVVHAGRWQDVLPQLISKELVFDAIYFDTFAESYAQFRDFFSEYVISLLATDGKWSFFNGMGADRQISYDVYQKVVEIDLFEAAFDVSWSEIEIPPLEKEWTGVHRSYWNIERYRLPLCKFMD